MERMTIESIYSDQKASSKDSHGNDKYSKERVLWFALIAFIVQLMFNHLQIILYNIQVKAWN